MPKPPDLYLATLEGRDMRSDPDLAAEAAKGHQRPFAELVRRHQAKVRGMARRLAGNESDGDDIAQAAFLTAWRKIDTYAGGSFSSWICTICYREFLQVRRRRKEEPISPDEAELIAFDPSAQQVSDRLDINRALDRLTTPQRICVTLCVAAGMSHREASEATGWPLGTIKSHVNRGVDRMRAHLAGAEVA